MMHSHTQIKMVDHYAILCGLCTVSCSIWTVSSIGR